MKTYFLYIVRLILGQCIKKSTILLLGHTYFPAFRCEDVLWSLSSLKFFSYKFIKFALKDIFFENTHSKATKINYRFIRYG